MVALSRQSFGIRAPSAHLARFRRVVHPDDSKFADTNISVRGPNSYVISGLPLGCSRSEIIKRFSEWKVGGSSGWAIVPTRHWVANGQSHWTVRADSSPFPFLLLFPLPCSHPIC